MTAIATLPVVLGTGIHSARPAASAVGKGGLYSCTTHSLVYQTDGSSWTTWATLGGSGVATDPIWDAKGDLAGGTGADTAARLAVGSNDTILMADSSQTTGLKWVASQTPTTQAFSDAAAQGSADTYARGDHLHGMPASPGGSGGAVVWLARRTASTSATLDFASLISSTYETYIFDLQKVRVATDGDNMYMRVGTGGGPTYDSGNNYSWATFRFVASGSATAGSGSIGYLGLDGDGHVDNAAASSMSGRVMMFDPAGAPRFTWHTQYQENGGTLMIACTGGGSYTAGTAVTALRFLASSGNLTSGVIDMYGVVHA